MPPKKKPRRKSPAGQKRARETTDATWEEDNAVAELPEDLGQQVKDLLDNLDYELHKDNLEFLARHIHREIGILLNEDEEAHVVSAANGPDLSQRLKRVVTSAWTRQQRAERAFGLLDEAGKGVVVWEDLRRVANELLEEDQPVTDEDLEEMIQEIDRSGDGILTKEDFHRLANQVNL